MQIKKIMIFILNHIYRINFYQKNFKEIYEIKNQTKIELIQVKRFNIIWKRAYKDFKFYADYKRKNKLPDKINNLKDTDKFPTISKFDISNNFESIKKDSKTNKKTKTGGTSGPVTYFPTGFMDSKINFNRQIYLREKFGINPFSKGLYIWGHSHKFNKNYLFKNLTILIKSLKNFFFNRKYLSAYDLSEEKIKNIINEIKKEKYQYVLSYASTFDVLVKFLLANKIILLSKVKFIITSENISIHISDILKVLPNVELINEYGMAETGVIGYNIKNNFLCIENLWHSFLIQKEDSNLILTDLDQRVFPLIRYMPDDRISSQDDNSIISFTIDGKKRPFFELKNGKVIKRISSIVLDHVFKNIEDVYSVQYYFDDKKELLNIFFCSIRPISSSYLMKTINQKLNYNFNNIIIKRIEKPIKTIAGKFKYLLHYDDIKKIIE